MSKKLLKRCLCFIVLLTSNVFASDVFQSGDQENMHWELSTDGVLTISKRENAQSGAMFVNTSNRPWEDYIEDINEVVINEGITSIGYRAFHGATSLKKVTIPETVTQIDQSAFSKATSLEHIEIPDSVSVIGQDAFSGSSSLQSVVLPNNDDFKLIPNACFKGTSVTDISIPDSVTIIGLQAFQSVSSLENIQIPDSVKMIGFNAFSGTGLKDITIPNSVLNIEYSAFQGATELKTVRFEEDSHLQAIGNSAFWGTKIESIVIPDSVETIGHDIFGFANSLKSVVFEGDMNNLTLDDDVFKYMNSNTKIYCQDYEKCQNRTTNNVIAYEKEDGLYRIKDENNPNKYTYFVLPDLMALNKNCDTKKQCMDILAAVQDQKSFLAGNKFYASLDDWISGKYIKKRIYTVEEAMAVSKPTENIFKIQYK